MQAVAAAARATQLDGAMFTFDKLDANRSVTPAALKHWIGFFSVRTALAFYGLLDAFGDLSLNKITWWKASATHSHHFVPQAAHLQPSQGASGSSSTGGGGGASEDGGGGDSESKDDVLPPTPTPRAEPSASAAGKKRMSKFPAGRVEVKRAKARAVPELNVAALEPRKERGAYHPSMRREQPLHIDPKQAYLMFLLVVCGGWTKLAACAATAINAVDASRVFITMLMLVWRTLLVEQPQSYITQARTMRFCPPRQAQILGTNKTKVTLDATEVAAHDYGKDLTLAVAAYSSYKGGKRVKVVIGISTSGAAVLRSKAHHGRITDEVETEVCGLYELLEPGDDIAADRGFLIANTLARHLCTLNQGYTRKSKADAFTSDQLMRMRQLSNVRIHVERIMVAIKHFKVLASPISADERPYISALFETCAMLANYNIPVVGMEDLDLDVRTLKEDALGLFCVAAGEVDVTELCRDNTPLETCLNAALAASAAAHAPFKPPSEQQ